MEERKPMYEFDLGFLGKVICSADTASAIQGLVLLAMRDARETNLSRLEEAYDGIHTKIYETLKSVGYYNEIL